MCTRLTMVITGRLHCATGSVLFSEDEYVVAAGAGDDDYNDDSDMDAEDDKDQLEEDAA